VNILIQLFDDHSFLCRERNHIISQLIQTVEECMDAIPLRRAVRRDGIHGGSLRGQEG
jgi:hypothetical protein